MKGITTSNFEKSDSKTFGLELLSDQEMMEVRGGTRPRSRDKDAYDEEEE